MEFVAGLRGMWDLVAEIAGREELHWNLSMKGRSTFVVPREKSQHMSVAESGQDDEDRIRFMYYLENWKPAIGMSSVAGRYRKP